MIPIEHPTAGEDGELTHPAFGFISASRISGSTVLFGSDFTHSGFMRVRIGTARLRRDLSNDVFHSGLSGFIEVDMSEAQWAHFVSSANSPPTQCTIVRRENRDIPGLPRPQARTDQFAGEAAQRMKRALQSLEDLTAAIEASGLSKVKQADLLSRVGRAASNISNNQAFVAEQFDEHMERTVQAAQMEVDAYVHRVTRDLGERALALANTEPPTLELPRT